MKNKGTIYFYILFIIMITEINAFIEISNFFFYI